MNFAGIKHYKCEGSAMSTANKDVDNKVTDDKGFSDEHISRDKHDQKVSVDEATTLKSENPKDSYEGRKHDPEIDGPQQDSQETDEVYADPRKNEDLPAGGKNVGDLNAHDLSQKNNP